MIVSIDTLRTVFQVLLVMVGVKSLSLLFLSARHVRRSAGAEPVPPAAGNTLVSVLIPCFNEGPTLEHSVISLLGQRYEPIEIIIVDDGSTDDTATIGAALATRFRQVHFVDQPNAGKATALNTGARHSSGDVVVCMDADSALDPDAVGWLMSHFGDDDVVAVGGNVKVVNRRGPLGLHQAVEYVSGLNLQRRCFASLGAMQVISGALGAFRRSALDRIGGFSSDTIVEDMDVTVGLAAAGGTVRYEGRAVAYTEAPETLRGFCRQRHRWTFGGFQVLRKYRSIMFRRHHRVGSVGLPYFLIFPWFDVVVSLLFVATVGLAVATGAWLQLVVYYLALSTVSALLLFHCVDVDGGERRMLVLTPFVEGLWYMHMINVVTVWAAVDFLRGSSVGWSKLERKGRNGSVPGRAEGALTDPAADDWVIDLREPAPTTVPGASVRREQVSSASR